MRDRDDASESPVFERVLHFWSDHKTQMWSHDKEFDKRIADAFGHDIIRAASGDYDEWLQSPRGSLAYIILLDQFTRNVFRGTPKAFAHDDKALAASLLAQTHRHDSELEIDQRIFLYMPMMHAEDSAMQAKCVAAFERLALEAPAAQRQEVEMSLDYARQHQAIIDRFQRFPHRNKILGRESTAEEVAFLKLPGSSF